MRVWLSNNLPKLLFRQTPGGAGVWKDCRFIADGSENHVDAMVVYGGTSNVERIICPPANTIFVTTEPPSIVEYNPRFLAQFAVVISCQKSIQHPGLILRQQGLPWNLGWVRQPDDSVVTTIDYDGFKAQAATDKLAQVAVASTRKAMTEGHRKRIRFIEELKEILGDLLDVYWLGPGATDKAPSILPYRYHIAIENSRVDHYWTEKLADVYLGRAYPFYFGCPNLADYFSPDAFTPIDLDDPAGAAALIRKAVSENLYDARRQAIEAARNLVLDRYNVMAMLSEMCQSFGPGTPRAMTIRPEDQCRWYFPLVRVKRLALVGVRAMRGQRGKIRP